MPPRTASKPVRLPEGQPMRRRARDALPAGAVGVTTGNGIQDEQLRRLLVSVATGVLALALNRLSARLRDRL